MTLESVAQFPIRAEPVEARPQPTRLLTRICYARATALFLPNSAKRSRVRKRESSLRLPEEMTAPPAWAGAEKLHVLTL